MEFVNPAIQHDLTLEKPLNINLGSGGGVLEGYYGLDLTSINGNVDIVADLNKPLDLLPDDSVGMVYSCHVVEHVVNFIQLMEELHRVVRSDGSIEIRVPHFSNPYFYSDPTHVRYFGLYSMHYFLDEEQQVGPRIVPGFYSKAKFKLDSISITLLNNSILDRIFFPRLFNFINKNIMRQDFYERRLCRLIPASGIIFRIRPIK